MRLILLVLPALLLLAAGLPGPARPQSAPAPSNPTPAPARRALLVGAWDYPRTPEGDFPPLRSEGRQPGPAEDVRALKSVLLSKLQFKDEEVKVLTSRQETTRQSILEAFRAFLVRPAGDGDIIFFHYSGHGSQLPDADTLDARGRPVNRNPSADEPDGLDETLVPTDHGPNGQNEIRDDDLNALVRELKAAKPRAGIVLTFDSCYSGTLVRGGALARGRSWEERRAWAGPRPRAQTRARAAARTSGDGLLDPGAAEELDYVALSAARERERAWQVFDPQRQSEMGRFTSALATALAESGPSTTYEDLFWRVRAVMANLYSDQHPQLEGRKEKSVFGGTARAAQAYVPARLSAGGDLVLEAGRLQGMTKGSVFALFPPETEDFDGARPLARVEVEEVGLDSSALRLLAEAAGAAAPKLPAFLKAKEVEHSYGGERLRLLVEPLGALARGAEVAAAVKASAMVEAAPRAGDGWDVRLRAAAGAFVLERPDDSVLARVADAPGAAEGVAGALRREARWRYAKALENRSPQSAVKVRMRLVRVEAKGDEEEGFEYVRDSGGEANPPVLHGGDFVAVEVMSEGTADAYLTLFVLSSDGSLGQLWPDPHAPITDNFISAEEAGRWVRLWAGSRGRASLFRITPPAGRDIFKLVATTRHVGFSTLLTRGPRTPFEKLVGGVLRGDGPSGLKVSDDWYTDSVTFETRLK